MTDQMEKEIEQLVRGGAAGGPQEFAPKAKRNGPPMRSPEHPFLELSAQASKSLVETARQVVREAEAKLTECERLDAELRAEMEKKSTELAELMERLNAFGKSVLDVSREVLQTPQLKGGKGGIGLAETWIPGTGGAGEPMRSGGKGEAT